MKMQNFHDEIQITLNHVNLDRDLNRDPNLNDNTLHVIIPQAKLIHMPIKMVKFDKHKHKISPWITNGILRSIHYRDNLFKNNKMNDPNLLEFDVQKNPLKNIQ